MSRKKPYLTNDQKLRKRIELVEYVLKHGVTRTVVEYGASRSTLYAWVERFEEFGIEGLRDKSRAPRNVRNKKDINGVLKETILNLSCNEPGLNNVQILGKLVMEPLGDMITLTWVKRTKARLGLTSKRQKKINVHTTRYEIDMPGALQIDTKYVENADNPTEKYYQFTAIDECTRVRFLMGSLFKSAAAATKFLVEAVKFFESLGVNVWRAQTDNGTEFSLPRNDNTLASFIRGETEEHIFTKKCKELGIRHRLIKPGTPELNGKVERSHRIDNERFYSRYKFTSATALNHALQTIWMPEYNERRPHGALTWKTPMEVLKLKVKVQKFKEKLQENDELVAA